MTYLTAIQRRLPLAVLSLTVGTATSQMVLVLASPVLTRIYTPLDFGLFGAYSAFVSITVVGVALRYETALVSATDEEAAVLSVLALYLVPVVSILAGGLMLVFIITDVARLGTLPLITAGIGAISVAALGTFTVARYWMVRRAVFRPIAGALVLHSTARVIGQTALGLLGATSLGLILGDAGGRAVGATGLTREAIRQGMLARLFRTPRSSIIAVASRYWKFPVISTPSSLLNALAIALPVPVLGHLFGLESAGYLLLTQRILSIPLAVIGSSVGDVFHSRLATTARLAPGHARPLFVRASMMLALAGLPFAGLFIFWGPAGFPVAFGGAWTTAGVMAVWVAPWAWAQLVVSPVSRAVYVYEGQELKLVFDALSLAAVLGSLLVASAWELDAIAAVAILSTAQVFAYLVYWFLILRLVRPGRT